MKQFIRYLYEYRQGKRMKNVGFIKVEQGERETVVHIHGKGLQLSGDGRLQLYLLYMKGQTCVGIWQGDLENTIPAVNYRLVYTDADTGQPQNYPLIEGIVMEDAERRKFAAVWSDMSVPLEDMEIWQEPEEWTKEPEEQAADDMEQAAGDMEQECGCDEGQTEGTREREMSVCAGEEISEEIPARAGEDAPDANTDLSAPQYIKIQRRDIAKLPRSEWRLANNSFLLHGYYNYHHLIIIDEGDGLWLGIPGIYHPREARAAEAFGFPRFIRPGNEDVELSEDEKNDTDDFGYWCRQVKR